MNESILDKPKNQLDKSVWKLINGKYLPTSEATKKINNVIKWVISKTNLNSFGVHITGSITSNQYSENSDIDLHFISEAFTEENVEKLNKEIRELFISEYKLTNDSKIGTHEIEIYFQYNKYQDMMSIGCYDYINKEWVVGPEFLSLNFDPYSEYFNEDMKYINSIISDIRNIILEIYELVIVISNSSDEFFKSYEFEHLKDKLARASLIFTNAREFRKVYSSPTSKDDALSKRTSRKWKIADSAFKLLDKFGYLAILKTMTTSYELLSKDENEKYNIINSIIKSFDENIDMNDDKKIFSTHLDESLGKNMSVIALIASLISIPEVTNAKNLEKDLHTIPQQQLNITNPEVTKYFNKNSRVSKYYGSGKYRMSYSNLVNLISAIAYNEGMEDHIAPNAKGQKYDDRALTCPIWTIINRSGGDANNFAKSIIKRSQYYSIKKIQNWKTIVKNQDLSNYTIYHPGIGFSRKTWTDCIKFAKLAIEGKLQMPVDDYGNEFGRNNMIANKTRDNKKDFNSWGKKCKFSLGGETKNTYGYDSTHDGWSKETTNTTLTPKYDKNIITYTIKKGDTLSTIASKHGTTVDEILAINTSIKDKDKIKPNQEIKIPVERLSHLQ